MTDEELKRLFDVLREENAASHVETRRDFHDTADRRAAENRHYFARALPCQILTRPPYRSSLTTFTTCSTASSFSAP